VGVRRAQFGALDQLFGRNYQGKGRSINHLLNHSGQSVFA